jgi:hypothetical protein
MDNNVCVDKDKVNINGDNVTHNINYPTGFDEMMESYNFREGSDAVCGPQCQREREIIRLRNEKNEAKTNKEDASEEYKEARRNYIEFTDGTYRWNEIVKEEAEQEVETLISNYQTEFDELFDDVNHSLASLKSEVNSMNQLRFVGETYDREIRDMTVVAEQVESVRDTNMRTSTFHTQSIQTAQLWRGYLSYLYWFLVIIYVVVVLVIGQQFRYIRGWGFLALLIIYPYLVEYLVPWIPTSWFISLDIKSPE